MTSALPLAAALGLALIAAGAARGDPIMGPPPGRIDFVNGTYAAISAAPDSQVNPPTGGTATFYLREPGGLSPPQVIDVSDVGVTLLPSSDLTGMSFPVNLFLASSPSVNQIQVTTAGPPTLTTTFQFVDPGTLTVSGSGIVTLLFISSGLELPTATDPAFTDFLQNGEFFAGLRGVSFVVNHPSGGSTALATFNSTDGSTGAFFSLVSVATPSLAPVPEPGSLLTWVALAASAGLGLWRRARTPTGA